MLGMPTGAQRVRRLFFMITTALTPISVPGFSAEAVAEQRRFDIPAGSLEKALAVFERQSGLRISADRAVFRDRQSAGASGVMSAQEALQRILARTNLDYAITGRTVVLRKFDAFAQAEVTLDTVTVTGPAPETVWRYSGRTRHQGGFPVVGDQDRAFDQGNPAVDKCHDTPIDG